MTQESFQGPVQSAMIVEGGAMRGVFSTGVLDGFLAQAFNPFDLYIGVSAGAGNLAAYLAEMPGRNYKIYSEYSLRPEFYSLSRFMLGGHLIDLDWLWKTTISETRLDLATIYAREKPFLVVMTNVQTGQPCYFPTGPQDLELALKASSAMPGAYRGFPRVGGRPMADGGLTDGLPVDHVLELGARRVMVIRSRPHHYCKRSTLQPRMLGWYLRDYPALRSALARQAQSYNAMLALIRQPPSGVQIIEVCPPRDFPVRRFSRNRHALEQGYRQGFQKAEAAITSWNKNQNRSL